MKTFNQFSFERRSSDLHESKMSDVHDTIGDHIDDHIEKFKNDGDSKKLSDRAHDAAQHVSAVHNIGIATAGSLVHEYIDSKLNEEVQPIDEISGELASRYLAKKHDRDFKQTGPNTWKSKKSQTFGQAMVDGKNTARALKRMGKTTSEEVTAADPRTSKSVGKTKSMVAWKLRVAQLKIDRLKEKHGDEWPAHIGEEQVKDRKTGKLYDPDEAFEKLQRNPKYIAQMKRMGREQGKGWPKRIDKTTSEDVDLAEADYGFFGTKNPKVGDRVQHKTYGASGKVRSISTQGDDTHVNFKLDRDTKIFGIPHKKGTMVNFHAKYLTPMKEEVQSIDEISSHTMPSMPSTPPMPKPVPKPSHTMPPEPAAPIKPMPMPKPSKPMPPEPDEPDEPDDRRGMGIYPHRPGGVTLPGQATEDPTTYSAANWQTNVPGQRYQGTFSGMEVAGRQERNIADLKKIPDPQTYSMEYDRNGKQTFAKQDAAHAFLNWWRSKK